jgi:hypothetical protein
MFEPHAPPLAEGVQLQMPRSGRQVGLSPPHVPGFAAEHCVQAPVSGPVRWQTEWAGSEHEGAPSDVQAMQVCIAGEQKGVTPPQSASPRQPTQLPPPAAVSQRGAEVGQREVSAVVQAAHTPFGRQIGASVPHSATDEQPRQVDVVASQTGLLPMHAELAPAAHWTHAPVVEQTGRGAAQSAAASQARQVCVVASQIGVVSLQSGFDAQPTHVPVPMLQSEAAPLHEALLVAEQAPHAPEGWQAGAAPLHSPSMAQPRQLCAVASQTGWSAGQSASFVQAMQSPEVASQIGVAPAQEAVLVAEHWPQDPLG